MDPRRRLRLITLPLGLTLTACAHGPSGLEPPAPQAAAAAPPTAPAPRPAGSPNGGPVPYAQAWGAPPAAPVRSAALAPAPAQPAAAAADADRLEGGLRVFAWRHGRVFPVRTAPLRVTTLALEPGETLIETAAGDTVRWQIGETTSGAAGEARPLVLIKPLTAGLATNLVLTTSRRVYLVDLSSAARGFDPAVSWTYPPPPPVARDEAAGAAVDRLPEPAAVSAGRYALSHRGRRPAWTPQAVFDDGRRTYIAFPSVLDRGPAPLLFVLDEGGKPVLANYRQAGAMFIVDRLLDRAELRLGERRPAVVRITRLAEGGGR